MIEWEIWVLFMGAYVLIIGMFYHHWMMGMRLIEVQEANSRIMEKIETIIGESSEKRKVGKQEDTIKKIIKRGMELERKE